MADGKFVWSIPATKLLISEYEACEMLYNSANLNYKNRNKRLEAYRLIAETINTISGGCTVEDVKKEINGLRSQYLAEKMKILQSIKSGADGEDVYKPTVYWFPLLKCLDKSTDPDESQSNLDGTPNETQSSKAASNNIATQENDQGQTCTNQNLCLKSIEPQNSNLRSKQMLRETVEKRKRVPNVDNILNDAANTMKEMSQMAKATPQKSDSLDIFGQFVAAELRGIQGASNKSTVRRAKRKIQELLMEVWDTIDLPTRPISSASCHVPSNQWSPVTQPAGSDDISLHYLHSPITPDYNKPDDLIAKAIHLSMTLN